MKLRVTVLVSSSLEKSASVTEVRWDLTRSWEVMFKPIKTDWSGGHRQTAQVRASINSMTLAAQTPLGLNGLPYVGVQRPPGLADLCQQDQRPRRWLRTLSKGAWVGCSSIWAVWDTELSVWGPGLVPTKGVGQAGGMEGHWPVGCCDNYILVSLKVPVSLIFQLQRELPLK